MPESKYNDLSGKFINALKMCVSNNREVLEALPSNIHSYGIIKALLDTNNIIPEVQESVDASHSTAIKSEDFYRNEISCIFSEEEVYKFCNEEDNEEDSFMISPILSSLHSKMNGMRQVMDKTILSKLYSLRSEYHSGEPESDIGLLLFNPDYSVNVEAINLLKDLLSHYGATNDWLIVGSGKMFSFITALTNTGIEFPYNFYTDFNVGAKYKKLVSMDFSLALPLTQYQLVQKNYGLDSITFMEGHASGYISDSLIDKITYNIEVQYHESAKVYEVILRSCYDVINFPKTAGNNILRLIGVLN